MNYQFWCRNPEIGHDRWHAQSIGTLEEILHRVSTWCRTYPHHQIAITPASGSHPITSEEYQRLAGYYVSPSQP